VVNKPFSHFSEALHAMGIGLKLSNANPKVILITLSASRRRQIGRRDAAGDF
jgi:hypothetical protein